MTSAVGDSAPSGSVPSDSAGIPFQHRELTSTGFENDRGEADPRLASALTGHVSDSEFMAAISAARLLVPVMAAPTETSTDDAGLTHDKQVDMAVLLLDAPDGTRALPVFSAQEHLYAWQSQARPVPVTAARAAQSAITDRCDTLVVDVGAPHQRTLRPSMLWALAQQREWLPAHTDPFVDRSVAAATREHAAITGFELSPGEAGILHVRLGLEPGLNKDHVSSLVTALAERLAADGEFRARVDGLAFQVV